MRGSRRLPAMAPHPGKDGGLCICVDVLGLNQAVSQERLWPSRVVHCEGPPHSYVRMPFGLQNTAAAHQHLMKSIQEAQVARHCAFLEEMEMVFREPPEPSESPRLRVSVAHEESFLQRTPSAAPTLLRLQN